MKQIALLLAGGLGDEDSGIHVPALYGLVQRLSKRYDIVTYSHSLIGREPSTEFCGNARVKFLPVNQTSSSFKRAKTFLVTLLRDNKKTPYDLIHGFWGLPFGFYSLVAARILRVPSVVSLLGGETVSLPDLDYGAMSKQPQRSMMRWVCRNADALTVHSQKALTELRQWGITRNDVHIIPPAAQDFFSPTNEKRTPTEPFRFLSLGDLNRLKDPFTLLDAFKIITEHVDARLRLIGADHLNGSLQQKVTELGLNNTVEVLGYVKHSEIPKHLAWADVLLHTSQHEGGGAVIAEAAASGVAICGTNVGLIADLSPDKAVSVGVGNAAELAKRALELLHQPNVLKRMRDQARQWAQEHNAMWASDQFGALYESLVARKPMNVQEIGSQKVELEVDP